MELTAAVAVIVAACAPFVVALLSRPDMKPGTKRAISIGVAVVLGVIVAIATRQIDGVPEAWSATLAQALIAAAIIVSLAQGYYRAFLDAVKAVEAASSPEPRRAAADDEA